MATPNPTGPTSTSWKLSVAGIISGLGILITGYVQNTNGEQTTAHSIVGGALALGSILGKLWHDGVFRKASILAAGSAIAADLPAWKADLSKAVSFVEADLPGLKTDLAGVDGRIAALEAKVNSYVPEDLKAAIREVLTEILSKPAT